MSIDILMNIFDYHNEASILLSEKYKPKEILFLYTGGKEAEELERFKKYYNKKFREVRFNYEKIDINNLKYIENVISEYKRDKSIFNLTSGNKLITLIVYSLALKNNIECQYIDIEKELLINLSNKNIILREDSFIDLNIEDIIKSVGGSIIVDSTEVYNDKAILKITYWIAKNLDLWEKIKNDLQLNDAFIRDECNPEVMTIDKLVLGTEKMSFYYEALEFLKSLEMIAYKDKGDIIKIYFLNAFIKGFIFKSGTWLEVLTKGVVEEIKEIDDIKNGLLFLWNDSQSRIKNELDVVAIKDSLLICISCKDSKKYDDRALNELNVYANQLGGDNVIKILVATMPPTKPVVTLRAKEMGINLVLYEGSLERFKSELKAIILKGN